MPPQVLDVARVIRDAVSPTRRRARTSDGGGGLARQVSPEGRVLAGPFEGLHLPVEAAWGGAAARLAGTYEEELAPIIQRILDLRPSRILDVGSAEGYYAVGFARALPDCAVYAFDVDPRQRRLCRSTARLNGTRNVRVRGRVDPARLHRLLTPGCVVLSDCEGYEDVLIDPARAPLLQSAFLLVELHEFAVAGVTRRVLSRFELSHNLQVVDARPRTGVGRPQLAHLAPEVADRAVREGRPVDPHPMQWAVLTPKR